MRHVPRSPIHEGLFGRMFRRLPPAEAHSDAVLASIAETMRETVPGGWDSLAPVQDGDNPAIPAVYTYLGQFIDHDITFDPSSSLQRQNDPDALQSFRSPRFDLDSVYGSGPADEPFQYSKGTWPNQFLVEANPAGDADLPRNAEGVALIGDPRNDENVVVSQLQLLFLQLHNKIAAQVAGDPAVAAEHKFAEAQQRVRWLYQWVVVHDFLPTICGADVVKHLYQRDAGKPPDIKLQYYRAKTAAYMPVEFAAAAFRFGHSQIRPTYDLNGDVTARPIFAPGDDVGEFDDLRGFRPLPAGWSIGWSLFAALDAAAPPQPSRLINSKLSAELFDLPGEQDPAMQSLAFRNLKRGQSLQLPSGQDVARFLRAPTVYTGAELGAPDSTPLWFYLLKESELDNGGVRLGHTGGRIVAEVLLGLLELDPMSYYNQDRLWEPNLPQEGEKFGFADLIRFVTG